MSNEGERLGAQIKKKKKKLKLAEPTLTAVLCPVSVLAFTVFERASLRGMVVRVDNDFLEICRTDCV